MICRSRVWTVSFALLVSALAFVPATPAARAADAGSALRLNERGYFETRGLNVLVFSNVYDGLFSDAKIAGVELIHHGVRTATNGDVRLSPTPGQWDPVPQLVSRRVNAADGSIEADLRYPQHNFDFTLRVEARGAGVVLSVTLPRELPAALEGRESVFRGVHYLLGRHPGSNLSFVSAVGTKSKEVAYGSNRADFSFIPGGVVPGVLILKPDFPENKEDWPFLWGENEYVVNGGAAWIFLVHAVNDLLSDRAPAP